MCTYYDIKMFCLLLHRIDYKDKVGFYLSCKTSLTSQFEYIWMPKMNQGFCCYKDYCLSLHSYLTHLFWGGGAVLHVSETQLLKYKIIFSKDTQFSENLSNPQ